MMYFWLIITGIVSGVLGGMGMGGGTLLIPLLTLIFNFNQKMVQGINLISFSIMAIFILIMHIKHKLVNVKVALQFTCFALVSTILGATLASLVNVGCLKICFGILLIVISLFEASALIKQYIKKEKTDSHK